MIACPCCHSQDSRLLHGGLGDSLFHTTDEKFDLRHCRSCGVIFLFPIPGEAELAAYYPAGYWWQTGPSNSASLWHRLLETYRQFMVRGQARRVRRLAANSAEAARLADIGCGDGLFLAACRDANVAKVGFDQSPQALRAAQQRGGLELVQGSVEALPFSCDSLSLVTLFHVLEHLPHPGLCLKQVRHLLRPGGWLIVQVPNAASIQRRVFGKYWAGFDVPRHLANYSTQSLRTLLERTGFRVSRVRHFSWRDNPAIPVMSLFPSLYPPARRLAPANAGARKWTNAALDLVYFFFVLLATPMALVESLLGRGGTVWVEARRE